MNRMLIDINLIAFLRIGNQKPLKMLIKCKCRLNGVVNQIGCSITSLQSNSIWFHFSHFHCAQCACSIQSNSNCPWLHFLPISVFSSSALFLFFGWLLEDGPISDLKLYTLANVLFSGLTSKAKISRIQSPAQLFCAKRPILRLNSNFHE